MKLKFLCLLFLFPSLSVFAQSPDNLIPRELFFKEKDKVRVSLSKDGETIFYQKKSDGSDSTLYYINCKSPQAEHSRRFDGVLVTWLPAYMDGLVSVVRQDTSQYVYYSTVAANTSRRLDVIPFRRLDFVMLSARFPNKVLLKIEAKEESRSGYYLLDLYSGNLRWLTASAGFQEIFFDENFTMVAGEQTNDSGGLTILRRESGIWKEVFRHPFRPDMFIGGLNRIISVTNDGKTIYATDNTDKDKTTVVSINVETGEITELASDPDADMLPWAASIDPNGKPTSVAALWGDTRRYVLDPAVQKDFDFLDKELNGSVSFAAASNDDKAWLVCKLDGGPTKYYHYDRGSQKLTFLFNDYSHLDGFEFGTRKAYTVTTRDSLKLPVHVYLPPGTAKADGTAKVPMPTIIYIHGGPWAGVTHWNNWFHTRNFELLANRGYAVINMEFRGTTGLGKKVTDAGDLQWGDAMHNDIIDVVNWAIKAGFANRKRIGIWGWSYGGYAANYALGKAPDVFVCGVSMYGITNLLSFGKLPFADNDLWHTRVGNPDTEEGAALLKKNSPATYVKQIKSPLLLTTGTMDERVPQEQNDIFAKALHDAGKEVVYFYYPEEVHDYRQPESWISFWAIAENFLHEKLGGRKEARKDDIEKGNYKVMFGEKYISEIK